MSVLVADPWSLAGARALVTGSGRGIGRAIAVELARRGAHVVVNSRSSVEEGRATVAAIESAGGTAHYRQADVGDHAEARALVEDAVARLGGLDVVVNNADWYVPQPFEDDDPEYWDRIIGVGMRSAIHVTHGSLGALKDSRSGRIITIAGDSGRVGLVRGAVHSGAMAALIAMTKSWARELAEHGIRANAVSPGPTRTRMWEEIAAQGRDDTSLADQFEQVLGVGEPEDIAHAVAFLASPGAAHVTGQTLSVNGGRAFPS